MFVTVIVKGTNTNTYSDTNGRFSIKASNGDVLLFSLLGYDPVEYPVTSQTKNISIQLKESTQMLDDAVVTALGITREEKSIGYAVSKVKSDELNTSVSNNWVNNLDGKVAGLSMEQASTGPGGAVRVTLRGENSLSHDNNEALFVIDGVPMISGMVESSSGSGYGSSDAPIDYGNGIGDINPEDIESVTVLKGPAATALYGSHAANGAVVITTKTGKDTEKKIKVELNTSVQLENAGYWPDFQNEYGMGNGNASHRLAQQYSSFWTVPAEMSDTGEKISSTYSRAAFGPAYAGQMYYNYNGANWINNNGEWSIGSYNRTRYEAQDWYKGVFQTGTTYNNSIAISWNPSKETSVRFSFSDKRNQWILPNTGYATQNFSISLNQQAGKHVVLGAKVTYYRKDSDNLPTTGYNAASPMSILMNGVPGVSIASVADEYYSGRMSYYLQRKYSGDTSAKSYLINDQFDNIYMVLNEHTNTMDRDRVFGNASITINCTDHFNILLRAGIDLASDFRTQRKSTYSVLYKDGYYKEQTIREFLNTDDLLLTYKNKWGDWGFNATFGGSIFINSLNNVQVIANRLDEPNVFILQNSLDELVVKPYRSNKQIYSLFGTASVSYKDMVFLDVTGRNDWSSTLPRGNRSYFYPSVSLGLLINKMVKMPKEIDIFKLRASWANVGNDTSPYNTSVAYNNSVFSGSYVLPTALQNPDLKPENVMSYEAGIQLMALKKRVTADIAFYHTSTTNQIIAVPADYITSFNSRYVNAGRVDNTGVEIALGGMPVNKKHFKWNIDFNISRNWNKLVQLCDGVEVWQLNTNTVGSRVFIYAYPGQELGHIYGAGYKRAPEGAYYMDAAGNKVDCSGAKIINATDGNPVLTGTSTSELIDYGSIYPDWKGGFSTSFKIWDFSLGMNFTYQIGGKAYSITNFGMSTLGKLTNSLEGRYAGMVLDGVCENADGTYSPNTTIITDVADYYTTYKYTRNNVEENIFDTSFLKLKEIRLDYSIPKKILQSTKVLSRVSLGLYVTNVFCATPFPIYDPEVATLTGASISRGIEACSYPMTRSYGFNLKLTFL